MPNSHNKRKKWHNWGNWLISFTESRHAGEHLGKEQEKILVQAGERTFQTTKQMCQAAIEMEKFLETQDAEVIFHGDGLMQETAKILKQRT